MTAARRAGRTVPRGLLRHVERPTSAAIESLPPTPRIQSLDNMQMERRCGFGAGDTRPRPHSSSTDRTGAGCCGLLSTVPRNNDAHNREGRGWRYRVASVAPRVASHLLATTAAARFLIAISSSRSLVRWASVYFSFEASTSPTSRLYSELADERADARIEARLRFSMM